MATTTTSPPAGARIGRWRWVICALLFFATTINYIDRPVLGILAPVVGGTIYLGALAVIHMLAPRLEPARLRSDV